MPEALPSVLIVDDVVANLTALEAVLEGTPCEVVRASDGNEALLWLLKREFAVMLLDVQMPGMDGYEVASYARANPATRDVPIIFLTAMYKSEERALRGYGSGAVDFLWKPVNAEILRAKVLVFVELYVARQRLAAEVAAHQRTLDELEQANAALRHFTNAASHDLRAPLRSITGFLAALDEKLGPEFDAEARSFLNRARRASERMDALLCSLLTYARLQKPAEPSAVKCGALLEQVKSDLNDALTASGAQLSVAELPALNADPARLYQLFLNLISNANKFRVPGHAPQIEVSAVRRATAWEFCVRDDGIGVCPEEQSLIFEAFQRLHPQSRYEGSGLGLMICRQIVLQHGGKIWLESNTGEGCKVCFTLPAGE